MIDLYDGLNWAKVASLFLFQFFFTGLITFSAYWLQERLMVVHQETISLLTLSRDLLGLVRSHVTRNGDECGVETTNPEVDFFCKETRSYMYRLINA